MDNVSAQTIILGISGIMSGLLVLIALKALHQIEPAKVQNRLTKQDIEDRIEREKLTLAFEQVKYCLENIFPLIKEVDRQKKEKKLGVVSFPAIENFSLKELKELPNFRDYLHHIQSLHDEQYLTSINNILNRLELISIIFNSNQADNSIAIYSIGKSICDFIETYFFAYCVSRPETRLHNYRATINVYHKWSNELKKFNLEVQYSDIDKQLKN